MIQPKILRITTVPISLKFLLKGQFAFMMSNGFLIHICSADGLEAYELAKSENISFTPIALTRSINPLLDCYAIFILFKLIKREQFDIVHSHTPKAGLIAMIAAKLAGVKIRMHTVAGLPLMEANGGKRIVLNQMERLTSACATKIYPNSFSLMEYMIDHKLCRKSKLKVLANGSSNGIDIEYFNPEQRWKDKGLQLKKDLDIPHNALVAIYIGRITKDKGINELVESLQLLKNTHLLLVGEFEPDLDPILPETKRVIENSQQIHYVGFQKDIRPYLSCADYLVFPSYREGFPNVPLQAGAMGLPSIVTNINGCNEIIVNNENGLIIPAKDSAALHNAMRMFEEDSNLVEKLSKNARSMIVTRFEQSVVWDALKEEYLTL
ncbi:MAG: glycosyltransferase involved in cell wall biosynthesis [Parvicella sp.]|jgi:glycosyltransferase involved in cell wall biosynthesis